MAEEKIVQHVPVLLTESLEYLALKPQGVYVDATFGAGGHTQAILEANPSCTVVALDWDAQTLERYGDPLIDRYGDRLILIWGNFAHMTRLLRKHNVFKVDGIIADFGTSRHQLLEGEGFSFHRDSPLDMRMSRAHHVYSAADIIAHAPENELIFIFKQYGQEPKARAAARAIVQHRKKKRIKTTKDLVAVLTPVLGTFIKKGMHPATKIFQALRIAVNRELEHIRSFLAASLYVLKPGGNLVCISFHSLEDRLVKEFFKQQEREGKINIITKKAVMPSREECLQNPASRSARLRAMEMLKVE